MHLEVLPQPHRAHAAGRSVLHFSSQLPAVLLKPIPLSSLLQWARDEFELLFHNIPEEVALYLARPGHLDSVKAQRSTALDRLSTILNCLTKDRPR